MSESGTNAPERLTKLLREFGLPDQQARALVALLRVGTVNSIQVAHLSGIPRTSTYRVMRALVEKRLVQRLPAREPAVWTSAGWEAVVDVLEEGVHEQFRQRRARMDQLRQELADWSGQAGGDPEVHGFD